MEVSDATMSAIFTKSQMQPDCAIERVQGHSDIFLKRRIYASDAMLKKFFPDALDATKEPWVESFYDSFDGDTMKLGERATIFRTKQDGQNDPVPTCNFASLCDRVSPEFPTFENDATANEDVINFIAHEFDVDVQGRKLTHILSITVRSYTSAVDPHVRLDVMGEGEHEYRLLTVAAPIDTTDGIRFLSFNETLRWLFIKPEAELQEGFYPDVRKDPVPARTRFMQMLELYNPSLYYCVFRAWDQGLIHVQKVLRDTDTKYASDEREEFLRYGWLFIGLPDANEDIMDEECEDDEELDGHKDNEDIMNEKCEDVPGALQAAKEAYLAKESMSFALCGVHEFI